ncbi:MAG TPA: DUF2079 domain-containing protein, partial [Trebonia sp.]|nr:DUF2079 domain-containing protein [Trebonia sp.]
RDPVVWTVAALVFGAYFVISLFRLRQLGAGYDLGIYTEYVKQLAHLHAPIDDVMGPGFNLLGNHFQVAVGLLAPFFRLFPSPATLLFVQALLTAVSVFPVVTAGFAVAGRNAGRLIGFAYGFSWGLQQMVDFDFHEVALAVPLLAFSVSALVRRRPVAAAAWALPLVFVKEDQGFTVAAIGVLLGGTMAFRPPIPALPRGSSRTALRAGFFLVVWGLFWSVLAIAVIIPHFNPLHEYSFWEDGGAIGGGHPFSVGGLIVQTAAGWPTKAVTVVLLLLPTAFAALGSPVALIALPSLVLRFVSTDTSFWGTAFHYNATVMPILFIAAAESIGRCRIASTLSWSPRAARGVLARVRDLIRLARLGLARHGAAMMAAVAVALAFQFPLSGLWQGATYKSDAHVAAADAAMAVVPDGATVLATGDLLPDLAARTDTFWIGNAGNPLTQYIVFDGVDSGYYPNISNVPAFIATYFGRDGYVPVFHRDDVYVYKRRSRRG